LGFGLFFFHVIPKDYSRSANVGRSRCISTWDYCFSYLAPILQIALRTEATANHNHPNELHPTLEAINPVSLHPAPLMHIRTRSNKDGNRLVLPRSKSSPLPILLIDPFKFLQYHPYPVLTRRHCLLASASPAPSFSYAHAPRISFYLPRRHARPSIWSFKTWIAHDVHRIWVQLSHGWMKHLQRDANPR
jgi:hypothetical protein